MYTSVVFTFPSRPTETSRRGVTATSEIGDLRSKERSKGVEGRIKRPRFEGSTLSSPP